MRLPPYTALDWLVWSGEMAAHVAVIATAARLPRPRPHLPAFVALLGAEVYIRGVEWLYLERVAVPGVPPAGAARALYHSVQALSTAWPAAVAALAWWVFAGPQNTDAPGRTSGALQPTGDRRRLHRIRAGTSSRWPPSDWASCALTTLRILPLPVKAIFGLWLAFDAALVAAFPLPKGTTQPALHAFAAACVVLGAVAIVTGWARRHERDAQVAGWLVVVEGVVALVGPWAGNVFAEWRTVGAGMYAVAFSLLAWWQWRQERPAPPAPER